MTPSDPATRPPASSEAEGPGAEVGHDARGHDDGRDPGLDPRFAVDDTGLTVPVEESGTWAVLFDGRPVLSLTTQPAADGTAHAPWVGTTRFYLEGRSEVAVQRDGRTLALGEVSFGAGDGRVAFVDDQGGPVVIDKWGLAQRPFLTRDPEVARFLAREARRVCDIAREEAGLELWIAFGTLLGAMRSGGVIGHDSDVDLAFLGEHETPARLYADMARLRRALAAAGLEVVNKTGSFITILYDGPDGSLASIDVYTCFYFNGLLYETASARAVVPREAILPLSEVEFEGELLPAPADPSVLLEVSYGPGWRHPDPDFVHAPSHAVRSRFDGWFGNVMRRRRDWEAYWAQNPRPGRASDFSAWVRDRAPADALVVELGIGRGEDALAYARSGRSVVGMDYARSAGRAIEQARDEVDHDRLSWMHVNLYDLRDTLTWGALVARRPEERRVVVVRGLVESVRPEEREYLWVLLGMVGRAAEACYLELDECDHPGTGRDGVWRFACSREEVRRAAARSGAEVVEEVLVGAPASAAPDGVRWRMLLHWSGRPSTREGVR